MDKLRIAIDGPAGAGKSTVARWLAARLGYVYLDTGAMYRALAVTAVSRGVDLQDGEALGQMARGLRIRVAEDAGVFRVWVDDQELTATLREPETDRAVKYLAMHRPVREVLVTIQQEIASSGGIVMEGRDITSVVLPDAEVKIFLTAKLRERARRRWRELQSKGLRVSWEEVLDELAQRDQKDHERDWGRLVQVPGAIVVDTTGMTMEEACSEIAEICEARMACGTRP